MAHILNIETATEISSVCISHGERVLAFKESTEGMAHARATTLLIEACLEAAKLAITDLDAVAISSGPGSYTALRVGSSIAKGICYALDLPLISISTLESLAIAASKLKEGDFYCPMIDARRNEVYTATYNSNFTRVKEASATILTPDYIDRNGWQGKAIFSGNGASKFSTMVERSDYTFTDVYCSSKHIAPLAFLAYQQKNFQEIAYFEPIYLKPPNITKSKKKLLS